MPRGFALNAYRKRAYTFGVCAILGLAAAYPALAQSEGTSEQNWWRPKGEAGKTKKLSAEERQKVFDAETKNLADNVTDDIRRSAISKIIDAAGRHQATPLVRVLAQRAPEKAFLEIVSQLSQSKGSSRLRRKEFVAPLLRALPQVSPEHAQSIKGILTHDSLKKRSVSEAVSALASKDLNTALAGVEVSALRPNGTKGVVALVPGLVKLLNHKDENLRKRAFAALEKATFLNFKDAKQWQSWLRRNATDTERSSAIADAAVKAAESAKQEINGLQSELLKERLTTLEGEKNDVRKLALRLSEKWPQLREKAITYLAEALAAPAKKQDAEFIVGALLSSFAENEQRGVDESESNQILAAKALQKTPREAFSVLLQGVAPILKRNGLSTTITVELLRTLRHADALPLLAILIEHQDRPARPLGDNVQLALIKQVGACAGGVDAEGFKDHLKKIFALFNSRLAVEPPQDKKEAYAREFRDLQSRLSMLVQFGRDVSPMTEALLGAAIHVEGTKSLSITVLSLNLARNGAPASAALEKASTAFFALVQSYPVKLEGAEIEDLHKLTLLSTSLLSRNKKVEEHWERTLATLIRAEKPSPKALALQRALAYSLLIKADSPLPRFKNLLKIDAALARKLVIQASAGPDSKPPTLQTLENALKGLGDGLGAKETLLFLDAATVHFKSEEDQKAISNLRTEAVKAGKTAVAKALKGDLDQDSQTIIEDNLNQPGASEICELLIADLEKNTKQSERRDALAKLLMKALAMVEGFSMEGIALEGEEGPFSDALKVTKARITALKEE